MCHASVYLNIAHTCIIWHHMIRYRLGVDGRYVGKEVRVPVPVRKKPCQFPPVPRWPESDSESTGRSYPSLSESSIWIHHCLVAAVVVKKGHRERCSSSSSSTCTLANGVGMEDSTLDLSRPWDSDVRCTGGTVTTTFCMQPSLEGVPPPRAE